MLQYYFDIVEGLLTLSCTYFRCFLCGT